MRIRLRTRRPSTLALWHADQNQETKVGSLVLMRSRHQSHQQRQETKVGSLVRSHHQRLSHQQRQVVLEFLEVYNEPHD